jgi:hypothetical protein
MKIVTGSIAASALRSTLLAALMIGAISAAYAQQSSNPDASGANGLQSGALNNMGTAAGTGVAPGVSPSPMPGVGTGGPAALGTPGTASPAPVLNNMRANGTSLNMSPDPRAPNVTGRPAPPR